MKKFIETESHSTDTGNFDSPENRSNAVLLSIVVPVRGDSEGLKRNLSRWIPELEPKIEWIIIDDQNDPPIDPGHFPTRYSCRYLRNPRRLGASLSRNLGLQMACGLYVLFFDADDILNMETLWKIVPNMAASRHDLIIFPYYIEQSNVILKHMYGPDMKAWQSLLKERNSNALFRISPYPWNRIVKRSLFMESDIRFIDTDVFSDIYAVWMMSVVSEKVLVMHSPISIYRNHNNPGRINSIRDERRLLYFIQVGSLRRDPRVGDVELRILYESVWRRRLFIPTLAGRSTRLRFLGYTYLCLRKFPRSMNRVQTMGEQLSMISPTFFIVTSLFVAYRRSIGQRIRRILVDLLWGRPLREIQPST